MSKKEFKRPDEAVMQQILKDNRGSVAEIALRLAWNAGLSREEMYNLKWSDVSLSEKLIYLPHRTVPIEDDDVLCFEKRLKTNRGRASEYVMASDRNHVRMLPQSISRVVRIALDQGGLAGITMVDLRHDYVIRMLEKHDWPYASRVTGTAVTTLYACYSEYFANDGNKPEKTEQGEDAEFKLWKIIKDEGTSPAGLALWMAWKLEMTCQEIIALTWEQVDLKQGLIQLNDRKLKMGSEFLVKLKTVKAERAPDSDPHVILTPKSQKGFDAARLSRVLRAALIRGGVDMTLQNILQEGKRKERDDPIVEVVAKYGSATRNKIMQELSLTKAQFYSRAERLVERGELVRVGQKLYLPGTVVPPEEQYDVIHAYLETMGSATRGDLANLLHINGNQCGVILRALMEEGKLKRSGQVYTLADQDTTMR